MPLRRVGESTSIGRWAGSIRIDASRDSAFQFYIYMPSPTDYYHERLGETIELPPERWAILIPETRCKYFQGYVVPYFDTLEGVNDMIDKINLMVDRGERIGSNADKMQDDFERSMLRLNVQCS